MPTNATLEAFGLYLARTAALVVAAPLIGSASSFSGYKIGLIFAVALLMFLATGLPVEALAGGVGPIQYGAFVLRELVIGVFLAFLLQAVVLAVRVASELIGHEMGFSLANIVDPIQGVNVPLVARTYETLFFLALLAMNGHHWMFRALAESYERAPIARMPVEAGLTTVALQMFTQMFAAGVTFAAPILVLLTLVSALIGLLARAVPQLNMIEFGFNMRITVGLGAMFVFAPALTPAMERLLHELMRGLDEGLAALGA